ncbi:MAG: hypothetical protein NUV57_02955 [archaeon]|nr:hypothetical protein [archaeon]
MDKEKILKDSVRKLLGLNISDKEIIENLKSVGVTSEQAARILQETKNEPSEKFVKSDFSETKNSDSDSSDIYSRVYDNLDDDDLKAPLISKPIKNPQYAALSGSADISELWEKGIMATVDSKLGEMEKIQKELDEVLDKKIKDKIAIEAKKFEVVLNSQRELNNAKIDAHLDEKSNEIKKVIESRAKHMEDLNIKVQAQISKIQGEKKFNAELLNSIDEKITGLDSIKSQMISDTNTAIMETESKFNEFMEGSIKKRDDIEARVNRTLQLESKITEGLLEDAKQKIDNLKLEKQEELTTRIQNELAEFEEMAAKVDPQGITERLVKMKELEGHLISRQKEIDLQVDARFTDYNKELIAFKKEVKSIEDSNLNELKKQYIANVDDLFAKNLIQWDKKLKSKAKEIDDLKDQIDLEKFNATMESLELFKQQFLNTVNKSIQDYNKSKRELAQSIIDRDKSISEYLKRIDSKMQELNVFEKKFASEVAGLIDKIPEEKDSKKNSSKNQKSK